MESLDNKIYGSESLKKLCAFGPMNILNIWLIQELNYYYLISIETNKNIPFPLQNYEECRI